MESGYEIITISRKSPNINEISPETLSFYKETIYLDRVGLLTKLFFNLRLFCFKAL